VSINVVKSSTASTITVALPKDVQQSATPLGGKLRVKCTDSRGAVAYLVNSIFGEMKIPSVSTLHKIARDSMTNKKFTIMMGHTHIGNKEELSLLDSKA